MTERQPGFAASEAPLIIARAIWALVAVSLSCLVAGLVTALGYRALTRPESTLLDELAALPQAGGDIWLAAFGTGFVFAQTAGLVAFVLALIFAWQGWRGLFVHVAAGFVLGVAGPLLSFGPQGMSGPEWPIFASAGAAGGAFYWLIAGAWLVLVRRRGQAAA